MSIHWREGMEKSWRILNLMNIFEYFEYDISLAIYIFFSIGATILSTLYTPHAHVHKVRKTYGTGSIHSVRQVPNLSNLFSYQTTTRSLEPRFSSSPASEKSSIIYHEIFLSRISLHSSCQALALLGKAKRSDTCTSGSRSSRNIMQPCLML